MSARSIAGCRAASVAVVGAGVAGLACARALIDQGRRVRVFERQHCPGGRLGTRRIDSSCFDHGVQYISTRNERFLPVLQQWRDAGIVAPWAGRTVALAGRAGGEEVEATGRFVGVPTMEAVAVHMTRGLDVRLGTGVERIERESGSWRLRDAGGAELDEGGFDAVVLAMPSPAALRLLPQESELLPRLQSVDWDSCWAVMLGLSRPSGIDFDAAFVSDDPILGWIARESSKPMRTLKRGAVESWMLHAHPAWSGAYPNMPETEAARWMQRAFAARLGRPLVQSAVGAYRWRWALPVNPIAEAFLFDERLAVGLAGDWCGGPRVEGAYLSGVALARAMAA